MSGLESLFSMSELENSTKGRKKESKGKEKKKGMEEKEKKSIRFPLPVRVRSGHICCDLTAQEYGGKTVSEVDIKKKIRECYPEFSGIRINLVKFSNKYTEYLEEQEKIKMLERSISCKEKEDGRVEERGLEFAHAKQMENELEEDGKKLRESECEDMDGLGDSKITLCRENDSDDCGGVKDNQDAKSIFPKGCWIKLEVHYQELAKNQTITYPVSVIVGDIKMTFGTDTGSIEEVREEWMNVYPEYTGCSFHYDDKQNILIPFMRGESEINGKKYKLPVKVGYLGLAEHYEAQDFNEVDITEATQSQIRELYAKQHPEFENALFKYVEEANCLYPVLNFKKIDENGRYCLPILVRGPGFQMTVEASDLKGKGDATLEEIREVIEAIYPEFSKERTEMNYDERGFVVPILKGSKKGVSIVSDREGQSIFFVKGRDGITYRVEQMPYGVFDCRVDGEEVDFHLCEKIPGNILKEILAFFKKEPRKEAAIQVFYDTDAKKYELYYPEQNANVYSVEFKRNHQLERDKVLVMDAHSHGCMPAFFSLVDNHDEKGTRLFLVIGNLDKENFSWKLRAGIAGFYKDLHIVDIFTSYKYF